MFDAIQLHCDAMDPKFHSNEGIITALQNLDLAKYLSLSNNSNIWWSEIKPILDFVMWLEKHLRDNVSVLKFVSNSLLSFLLTFFTGHTCSPVFRKSLY